MIYTILTLNRPERAQHREYIRNVMYGHEEVLVECVDGTNEAQLRENIDAYGFNINFPMWRPGEAGVWYSNINAWDMCYTLGEPLLVFEDDAVPNEHFRPSLDALQLPQSYDMASLYTPYRSQWQRSAFRLRNDLRQEHGLICMLYSSEGAGKLLDLLHKNGLKWPVDIWVFKQDFELGHVNGYYPSPTSRIIIEHDFDVPTTVHENDRIEVYRP